jgi:hypothetical protein
MDLAIPREAGGEIWTGPINNLESLDFFVDVQ